MPTAAITFLLGVLVGLLTISNPILWTTLIGAMLLGRLIHFLINGE